MLSFLLRHAHSMSIKLFKSSPYSKSINLCSGIEQMRIHIIIGFRMVMAWLRSLHTVVRSCRSVGNSLEIFRSNAQFCSNHGVSRRLMSSDQVTTSRSYIPRRAVMYVPGNDDRKIAKIPSLDVDCVVLDCEDGVAVNKKKDARNNIRKILDEQSVSFGRSECTVRVNSVESGLCDDDLDVILSASNLPSSIHLPKIDFVDHLDWFAETTNRILESHHVSEKMNLILFIESAQGLLALPEICKTAWQLSVKSHFIPDAVVFGSDDYCADIGATRTKDAKELLYARQYLVMVAKAFKLQAIDIVHIDYKDTEGLRQQALEGFQMGFTGKQLIHPGQVQICQQSFTPSPEKIEWARELINSFAEYQDSGKGAFTFRGSMIDMPLVLQAKNIVELAAVCGK